VITALVGGAVGMERELAGKSAGLRTHMLVAVAACLLVDLGPFVVSQFQLAQANGAVRTDPIRIIEAVITGVAFLGAGTIITHPDKSRIEGLTTAASILLAPALSMVVALEQLALAFALLGMTLAILALVHVVERGVLKWRLARRPPSDHRQSQHDPAPPSQSD
jgi:putative Mg2+ transporter-C (MgtC) family protein